MRRLIFEITTQSNLYIGGMPKGFEIGGIDMHTATREDKPYIPASSFKGALREICLNSPDPDIIDIYCEYEKPDNYKNDVPKQLYIFGIPWLNRSPKVIFTDFILTSETTDYYSIDTKNSIDESDGELLSNPRTYCAARPGLEFKGDLILDFDALGQRAECLIENYMIKSCREFNNGLYRIGNSKSRGYGEISIKQIHEK